VWWGKRGPVASCLVTLLGLIAGGATGIALTFRVLSTDDDAFVWLGMFLTLGLIGAVLGGGLTMGLWLFLTRQEKH
jgi:hypothetical protein